MLTTSRVKQKSRKEEAEDESQTSTRQIKKVCQDNDLQTPSGLHNADESQNKQLLRENSDHLDNSFKEQARQRHPGKEDMNKNKESSFKRKYNILL